MARYLFTTSPLVGHAGPMASIAAELVARGHHVEWLAADAVRPHLLPVTAPVHRVPPDPVLDAVRARSGGLRYGPSLRFYFTELLPALARSMRQAAADAVADARPDVVVVEHACMAGMIAARRAGVAWVGVEPFISEVNDSLAALPGFAGELDRALAGPQVEAGLSPLRRPVRSPHGTLVCGGAEWLGLKTALPAGLHLIGVPCAHRPQTLSEDLRAELGPHPRIYLTFGTTVGEEGSTLLDRMVEAAARVGSVVVASPRRPRLPPGGIWRPWLPQLAVLAEVDAVVCHGGHNTVVEALAADLPVLVVPRRDDGPLIAGRLVTSGAGLSVAESQATPERLLAAMGRLVGDPSLKRSAASIGADLRSHGGATAAADILESVS